MQGLYKVFFRHIVNEQSNTIVWSDRYIPILSIFLNLLLTTRPSDMDIVPSPVGSEIYQETLAKALANHFHARFLLVDSLILPGVSSTNLLNNCFLMALI